ncbi:hypothetical protein PUNSTDRAFT_140635 [Punctularia strigosozonata HHB-11173 SS5]|uniref:uncharacterized protein n=1 Tax=Punctularia strigosozonata (strain HHB-11173) TaxID=741275 RepID=UPI0004416433|nr:uncharacterized protein PUNSTDRAFT_140635 [Punctularia strigosozonata HHB-11173 SS5]EIN14317.1 hypothetical protein PUNSTDRAFT_140635 [Punctularia strigosozonata HHB-11173 SS5]
MHNRRASTLRNFPRQSGAHSSDELGLLRETTGETLEESLRRQLTEKDRENDRLRTQIQTLQVQLSQRPAMETIQEMEKEYNNLELLLQGTQRENERCMAELERGKAREKILEQALSKVAGENWQSSLDVSPVGTSAFAARLHQHERSNSGNTSLPIRSASPAKDSPDMATDPAEVTAQIEQVRMLILGMEQRLQTREDMLIRNMERAETEGRKFEELKRELQAQ